MTMTIFGIIAAIALFVGDLFVIIGVFFAAMVLLTRIAGWIFGWQSRVFNRYMLSALVWAIFGAIFLISLVITGTRGPLGISRLSLMAFGLLLLGSFLLLALSVLVPSRRG